MCPERTPAPESGLAPALPHSVLTWGPQPQPNGARRPERMGPPRRRRGAGHPGARRLALVRPPPDAGRAALSHRARPRTDGSSAAWRPGRWQSTELAAPRLFVFEPRSPKLQPWGGGEGEGRGREARGGRRPAGASEEPGSGALAPTPPPRARGAGGDRGEFGRRALWGDGERKLFN